MGFCFMVVGIRIFGSCCVGNNGSFGGSICFIVGKLGL